MLSRHARRLLRVVLYLRFLFFNPARSRVGRATKWIVDFELDTAQAAWLAEVRDFLHANVTPGLRSEIAEHGLEVAGGEVASFRRKIGDRDGSDLTGRRNTAGWGSARPINTC